MKKGKRNEGGGRGVWLGERKREKMKGGRRERGEKASGKKKGVKDVLSMPPRHPRFAGH